MTISKDDFELLNNFAHDLKTPLAAVKSYIELMEVYGELNERQRHFYDRAQQGVDRIQRIVTALLDYSRLEQNRSLNLQIVDVYKMVETIVGILESAAADKKVTIDVDIPVSESQVYADALLLEHAIFNLLSNAIKYNKHGGKVFVRAQDAGTQIRMDISDTGIGIPRDDQARVWERFYRVERRGAAAEIEGTGLGLAIVRGVIERHGGQIRLTSTEGRGTTFTFTIPRPHSSSQELDREPRDDIPDYHQEGKEELNDSDADIRE